MENLNTAIKSKILEYLKSTKIGASSSEIAKNIGHNRITVTKYLEIMKAHKVLDYEGVAQAKLWYINNKSNKPTVLIVDDEPHVVNLVALSLIPEKYNIVKAFSGLDAIEKVHKENPEVIVLDLMMPGMDGYEVCQKIKENALTQHIPIIILSAKGEIEDKLKGLKIGADDYITKPFDPMELEARVERTIRRSHQDQDAHPLTRLPGREAVKNRIRQHLLHNDNFVLNNIVINNLGEYNKQYGFNKGEHVLTLASRVIAQALKADDSTFLGHTMRDSFLVVSKNPQIIKAVRESFTNLVPYLQTGGKFTLGLNITSIDSSTMKKENLNISDALERIDAK